ncbi:MAG: hypothetical protein OSB70_14135 [Myxococcota bacterium]|nr:hypothetical protein [Myxococcota bacterium]
MERYETYVELLQGGGAAVMGSVLWSGVGLAALVLVGLWLPLSLPSGGSQGQGSSGQSEASCQILGSQLLALALAGGFATAIAAWSLSLYLAGDFFAGNLILLSAALLGVGRAWNYRAAISIFPDKPTVWWWASFFALALVFWQHAATELPIVQDVPRLVFSDLHRDLGAHVQMAGLVRDGGLPMPSFWGALENDYWALTHTGHLVLIAGFSEMLGISLYQSTTLLWVDATLLIAWGVLALLSGSGMPGSIRFGVVVATLVWGAFSFPQLHQLYDPLRETPGGGFELDAPGFWIAARGFWNLPQTLSVALTLAGALVLERFGHVRRRPTAGYAVLATTSFLWVAAGLTKPSLFIFFGPALLIWLVLNRACLAEFVCALGMLSLGFLAYALPALLYALPASPQWTFFPNAEQASVVGGYLLMASPALVLMAIAPFFGLVQEAGRVGKFRVLHLAMMAAGGSLIFALVFREDQFVGFRVFQPNVWWGISGCAVLLVPFLSRSAWADLWRPGWKRLLAGGGLAVALLQVFNGFCLALVYPTLNLRGQSVSDAVALAEGRSMTPAGTRYAVDPMIEDYDLLGYLSRPTIMPGITGPDSERRFALAWSNFAESGGGMPDRFRNRIDAVILHRDRRAAGLVLRQEGWQSESLGDEFELWRQE